MSQLSTISKVLDGLEERDRQAEYINNPVLWAQERAGVSLWSKQAEVAMSVAQNHDVVVKASFGVGKSYLAALLMVWFVDTRHPDDLFVASTAPSGAQIGTIIWRNMRLIIEKIREKHPEAPVPGYITGENEWKLPGGVTIGIGRKPADHDAKNTFQGIHAHAGVIAVGDEAVSLPHDLILGLQKITSNQASRRFLICNPTEPTSYVAELFEKRPKNWTFHTISAFDLPAFTGELPASGDPEEWSGLTDQGFVDAIREEYGEDSPEWKVMILGEFADTDRNTFFTGTVLARAHDAEIGESGERPILGVDVARFGKDSSVIYLNDGGRVRLHSAWRRAEGTETANRIHRAALDTGAREVRIDSAGIGAPIKDQVVQLSEGKYTVREMIGNAKSKDIRKWVNWRAWAFDAVRHAMLKGEIDLDLEDKQVARELQNLEYFFRNGAIQIESKEDIKKRGGKSPDYADAFMYAALPDEAINPEIVPGDTVYYENDAFLGRDERMWDLI